MVAQCNPFFQQVVPEIGQCKSIVRRGRETRAKREAGSGEFARVGCPIFSGKYEAVGHLHLLDWVGRKAEIRVQES